jgi:tetratricopeptide (TPR) repeat protein
MKALKIVAVVLVIAAAVASIRQFCLEPYLCNIEAKRVKTRTERLRGRADLVVSVAARENLELLQACQQCFGTNVAYLMIKAANETALQDYGAAEKTYLQALSFDRRPELYLNLGFTQLDAGKIAEGTQSLLTACRFNFAMLAEVPEPKKTELTAVIVRERYLIDQRLQHERQQ